MAEGCLQDQMSSLQPQTWPVGQPVQNTGLEKSGDLNEPQNPLSVEVQMVRQACKHIELRMKMADVFYQYRAWLGSRDHDVTVTSDPPSTDERICVFVSENKKVVPLAVRNSGVKTVYLTFWAWEFVENIFTIRDSQGNIIKSTEQPLGPGQEYKFKVHFHSAHAGFFEQLLVFKVGASQHSSDTFQIMRLMEVIYGPSLKEEPLPAETKSACNPELVGWTPSKRKTWFWPVVPLKNYPMPDNIENLKKADMDLENMPLDWKNYCKRFRLLLHLEEFNMKTKLEEFNLCAQFTHKDKTDLLSLQLSGVFKSATSMLHKNKVLVTPVDGTEGMERRTFIGWVHHVDDMQLYLEFSEEFLSRFKEGMQFRVNFALERIPLRMQHRAVELACKNKLEKVLFPTGQCSSRQSKTLRLTLNNQEQYKAIEHIVAASAKPAPYLLFGPPGTGKTATLVEAIKEIVKTLEKCNILACAPSNSATDHLCEEILKANIGTVMRLYCLSFPVKKIPSSIESCSNLNKTARTLSIPHKHVLMSYKIMVTTLQTAGRLVTAGIPNNHYSYLFVDEAGYATEPESLIPIAGLLNPVKCQIVLAGDPKQLGPVIMCRLAEKHGMGLSMMERLMTNVDLYKSHEIHGLNSHFVTKLLRNYRSHRAILKIPNELFYDGELQPYANEKTCGSYCQWKHLPKKGFPLIFHGVAGCGEHEGDSPSIYNMPEVEVLKEYLKALVDHLHQKGVTKIEPTEIGIIAPYRKQVAKIKKALLMDKDLSQKGLENMLVGTVEQFQGKEFNVILMSTVRGNPKLAEHRTKFTLGFLHSEKRFNVAVTRARALLIVVGDPRVLRTDRMWNHFIHYCVTEGAYRGITVSDKEEDKPIPSVSLW